MKNPNGYGTVAKLSGNRRNPYVVRKTIGWNEKGHPIYDTIAYCATREEGNIILAEYNKNPYDIDAAKITLTELFEKFKEKKLPKMSLSSQGSLKAAFKHCEKIHKMKYREIKSFHMQDCIDNCGCAYSTQWAIKNLFGHLDKYALELDVINKTYSALLTADSVPETSKMPFSDDEIKTLWEHSHEEWVDTVLIFIYSGFRISELLNMKIENVDLENQTFKWGTKTKNGKDRIVPIHSKIFSLVQNKVQQNVKYLFEYNGKKLSTTQYYTFWNTVMKNLNMQHTPHECRHTFRSKLDSAGANKKCMDLLMGHKSKEVGERVYTHKTIQELRDALELFDKEEKAELITS